MVLYSHLQEFSTVCCDPHNHFSVVDEAEVHFFFLKLSFFFYDLTDVGNFISGSSAFSKYTCTSENSWFLLKLSLKDSEHYLANM